jgi:XRE family transcriptional regulator, regulator of sulfur utilization
VTKDLRMAVGRRFKELRLKREMSQEVLADKAGLHRNYIGYVERADRSVTVDTLGRLTHALDITLAEFFQPFTNHFRMRRTKRKKRRPSASN